MQQCRIYTFFRGGPQTTFELVKEWKEINGEGYGDERKEEDGRGCVAMGKGQG